jgi:hypothetical protein
MVLSTQLPRPLGARAGRKHRVPAEARVQGVHRRRRPCCPCHSGTPRLTERRGGGTLYRQLGSDGSPAVRLDGSSVRIEVQGVLHGRT